MNHWLMKSDPEEYSWENLKGIKEQRVPWDGVRNYQARNFLQKMKKGDLAFFYHSAINTPVITGIIEIIQEAYPDPTQFDEAHPNYDPKSDPDKPRWFVVDVKYRRDIVPPVALDEIKQITKLKDMVLFQNTRLSVQPVKKSEWNRILKLRRIDV